MYKEDLALNNQQWLICHKTQQNQIYIGYLIQSKRIKFDLLFNSYFYNYSKNKLIA